MPAGYNTLAKDWWRKNRLKYNIGLITAGIIAFVLYVIAVQFLVIPNEPGFDITIFTILIQALGYIAMMGIANLFYNIGYLADVWYNTNGSPLIRQRLYNLGYWFSLTLPFIIPMIIVVQFLFRSH